MTGRNETTAMAQMNSAEVLMSVLSDPRPLGGVFGMLSIINYAGVTVQSFDPQKMLDKISTMETGDSEFKKELKQLMVDGFENMVKFRVTFDAIDKRIMTLYQQVEAGKFNAERNTDDGSQG